MGTAQDETRRPASRLADYWPSGLAVPAFMISWSILVLLPIVIIVAFSFLQMKSYRVVYEPTLATWTNIIVSERWFTVVRTLRIALTITAIELLLAFPFALWMAKRCRSKSLKAMIVTLLTIPFFLDMSSRIIVWRSILDVNGGINSLLLNLGLIDAPIQWLLYSEFAVHFGMIGSYFPAMVFPIFTSLVLIDDEYIHASGDLGGNPLQTLRYIILPLAMPGIVAGIIFTLVPLMAAFVEPRMLGGGFVNLLGDSINSALQELKYPTAAALSTIVIVALGVLMVVLVKLIGRREGNTSLFQVVQR
ncbi:MAG: ABC transporter permease [Rhizobiaceae bacterium]|nr:ABC transporter permease [Rhizobiaceae bacterium]